MNKNNQRKKTVLGDHKKVGSRFIPPMRQIGFMKDTSFINQILPEVIWMGLIFDNLSYPDGFRFLEEFISLADTARGDNIKFNFAYSSSFGLLNIEEKNDFINKLSSNGILDELRQYLEPLVALYEDFPLRFIGLPDKRSSKEELINQISACAMKYRNKYETPGEILNAAILFSRMITNSIFFSKDMELPDFNAIINAPESKEASRAAGFVRASALVDFGASSFGDDWARYFWNQGYELSPCDFHSENDDDK